MITLWYRRGDRRRGGTSNEIPGSTAPTAVLDHSAPSIHHLLSRARRSATSPEPISVLRTAYVIIRDEVRPVYALEETTATSTVLARGSGSCSQRLAVLESAARALGISTRVRTLLIDRSFWYRRFQGVYALLPHQILLVWPEFDLDGQWRTTAELFGPIGCRGGGGFINHGSETLFEAAGRCAVDWDGPGRPDDPYDLSHFVRADLGYFTDRDDAFARAGQTLRRPIRLLADPIFRRIGA